MASNEIAKRNIDPEEFRNINSMDDALALMAREFGGVVDASEAIGDGFELLDNKDRLLAVPFVAVVWDFVKGDFSDEFVSMRVVTASGEKWVVNDGSTGIRKQLRDYSNRKFGDGAMQGGGLVVAGGLRKSEYNYTDDKGKEKPATTYYLETGKKSRANGSRPVEEPF